MTVIKSYLNKPYRWGGDDPSGIDCSGLIIEGLKAIGVLKEKEDFTAESLYHHLLKLKESNQFQIKEISQPQKGALIFFQNDDNRIYHCSIALNLYFQIGAMGGDATTISKEKALAQNAFVKIRPISNRVELRYLSIFG